MIIKAERNEERSNDPNWFYFQYLRFFLKKIAIEVKKLDIDSLLCLLINSMNLKLVKTVKHIKSLCQIQP